MTTWSGARVRWERNTLYPIEKIAAMFAAGQLLYKAVTALAWTMRQDPDEPGEPKNVSNAVAGQAHAKNKNNNNNDAMSFFHVIELPHDSQADLQPTHAAFRILDRMHAPAGAE
jgi:hypothetical protein